MSIRLVIHNLLYRLLTHPQKVASLGTESTWSLHLDSMEPGSFVVSGGAGKDISFELQLVDKIACKLVLLDPSPTGIKTVAAIRLPQNITFEKKALTSSSGVVQMSKPLNMAEGSWRPCLDGEAETMESTSLVDILKKYESSKIDLLKIDIEGYEYEVLRDAIKRKIPIKQICVEIHEGKAFGKTRIDRWVLILALILAGYTLIYQKDWDYTFLRQSA